MIFTETKLKGAYIIELEKREDERGFFARTFCQQEFHKHGLKDTFVQCNLSYNQKKGTLRGMHYQKEPYAEVKLVRCIRGSVFDVIVDLREKSPTYQQWFGLELSEINQKALYVPEGFAHGFLTLENHSEVFYQVSQFYHPDAEGGVRWNDPTFKIAWPLTEDLVISEKDRAIALS